MNKLILFLSLALAVSGCASTSVPLYYRACQLFAAAGAAGDLASTEYILGANKGVEANPWLGRFSTDPVKFGVFSGSVAAAGIIAVDEIPSRKVGAIANCSVGVARSFIIANNRKFLK